MALTKLHYHGHEAVWNFAKELGEGQSLVVTPNPIVSDAVRQQLKDQGLSDSLVVDTISNFMKTQLKAQLGEEFQNQYVKNSTLFLILALVWQQREFGDFANFQKAFKALTDLRSFSINCELFAEFFETIEEQEAEKIIFLWKFMETANLWDEQVLYTKLNELDFGNFAHLFFVGFDFLSGNQIDSLNMISEEKSVFVSIPSGLTDVANSYDWINWLTGDDLELEVETGSSKVRLVEFEPSNLFLLLNPYLQNLKNNGGVTVSSCLPNLDLIEDSIFIEAWSQFKIPIDLFKTDFNRFESKLDERFPYGFSKDELITYLEKEINEAIKSNKIRNVKLYSELLNIFEETSQFFSTIDDFGQMGKRALLEVLRMNLPRLNFTNSEYSTGNYYSSFKNLSYFPDRSKNVVLIVKKDFPDFSVSREIDESLFKLASIGPIRRSDFELQFKKATLKQLLEKSHSTFFIEKGVREQLPVWSALLDDLEQDFEIQFEYLQAEINRKEAKVWPGRKLNPITSFSASSLQSYIDCPRSFYLKYIERKKIDLVSALQFDARDEGILFHDVVSKYFERFKVLERDTLSKLVQTELELYLLENKKKLSALDFRSLSLKCTDLAENILKKILPMKLDDFFSSFQFEAYFSNQIGDKEFKGYIDLKISTPLGTIIFDLKRSSSSIPSHVAFSAFEKIQLWFYGAHVGETIAGVGYLCANDMDASVFHSSDDEVIAKIKAYELAKTPRTKYFTTEKSRDYNEFEKKELDRLDNSLTNGFSPHPVNESICGYCEFSPICVGRGSNA